MRITLFHRHQWETIDVQHVEFQIVKGDGTVLLQRCECGRVRVERLNGFWSPTLLMSQKEL